MNARRRTGQEAPGQDSFLDIVANLVGILIILVMVIGVRAKDAMLDVAPAAISNGPPLVETAEVEHAQAAAAAIEADVHVINAKIRRQQLDIDYRRAERNRVQLLVQATEQHLADRRQQMEAAKQLEFDRRRAVISARDELEDLQSQITSLASAAVPAAIITHLPTPMAKTVFGKELHFRLHNGRLAHVPWETLVDRLREEAPSKVWRLKDQEEFTETLGPVDGFWMKYSLVRRRHAVPTRVGVAIQQGVELDHFVLVPVTAELGELLSEAVQDGSRLRSLLAAHPPAETIVTVWTYPDSFAEFRQLKALLFEQGYLTAGRPLPDGFPIGGSPHGRRSAAE